MDQGMFDYYEKKSELVSGSFGWVYKVEQMDNYQHHIPMGITPMAMKVDKNEDDNYSSSDFGFRFSDEFKS